MPRLTATDGATLGVIKPISIKISPTSIRCWDFIFMFGVSCGLTKKAEPPPTRGVDCNRSANGGWLRRLVRHHGHISLLSLIQNPSPAFFAGCNNALQGIGYL